MGSSMAENHPVGFQWVIEAREKNGAKVIHVDPRFTRTSAMADYWLPLRAGSDLVFLGAMIRYVLEEERFFREYVVRYTNAAVLVREDFRDTEELGGVFSGPETWLDPDSPKGANRHRTSWRRAGSAANTHHDPERDESLQHPRCVFQVMRRHFARYTPELVEQTCGVPKERFLEIARRLHERFRTGEDRGDLLRGRLDAALQRRADHSRRFDPSTPPRQHRTSRRRNPGVARTRFDSGIDRHTDALRHPSRLPADADVTRAHARFVSEEELGGQGLVEQHRQVHRVTAEGVLRRCGDARE